MKETTVVKTLVISAVVLIGLGVLCSRFLHVNDVDKIQIIQNVNGTVEVRREGGWYMRAWPRIWEYPKASVEICSDKDKDAIVMQFSNKTTASLNCQIGYRIDSTNDQQVIRLHQQVEGSDEKVWQKTRTMLQTVAQCVASQYTPSESVEKFPEFAQKICDGIVHNKSLLEEGIDVVSFTCAGLPKYDTETQAQFAKQKEADLAKRLALAEQLKLESEKLKVEANYAMQIAEQKGQAEAQMAKDVQSAEREKKLAEIAAQKQVEVARLEKEQMLIKAEKEKEVAAIEIQKKKEVAKLEAEKEFEVAEIAKKTEKENLEKIQLMAQQKIAEAEAKKKAIELAGAITELQQAELEYGYKKEAIKWESIGKGIAGIKLPQMMNLGGCGDAKQGNPLDYLINLMTVEKLNEVNNSAKK